MASAAAAPEGVLLFGREGDGYNKWWDWRPVGDVVMGGQSTNGWEWSAEVAEFSGTVSDANGGGFASVRFDDMNKEVWDRFQAAFKAGCDSIAVSAKPTDRDFKIVLRSQDVPYGVYYTARMHTTAEGVLPSEEGFVTYIVPLAAFEPRVQGKRWQGGPALGSFEHVRSVGFMVGDGQLGAYSLQARSVFAMNMAAAGWAPVTGDRAAAEGVQSTLLEEGRVVLTSVPTDAAPPRKPKELVREVPEGEEVPPPLSEDVLQGRVPRGATEDRAQSEL